jgi:glutamate-1-semialdehyde 2,1-aminomutase
MASTEPLAAPGSNSAIVNAYRERTPGSARLIEQGRRVFPGGLVHDARRLDPYPLYVNRALGSRKWDVDGNEYVDYYGGHGALILGHNHPQVMAAIHEQLDRGTHYAACHELEVRWGERVIELVPCAERVRFFSSGTEANLMALRLARAWTGKPKLVRFQGHFHGWQDHAAFGYDNHFDGSPTPGVLDGIADNVLLAPPDDLEATARLLESRDDVAAVILEPTGASFGFVPMGRDFVAELRRITSERGIVLIFDEVVTGFRVSPGGAQAHYGITPDMATFAKIVAGGLPGGCLAGPKSILDLLDFDVAAERGFEKIAHHGTYNANPTCAAAGLTALGIVAETDACARASAQAGRLRAMINEVFAEEGVPWAAYGEHSAVYFHTNPDARPLDPLAFDPAALDFATMKRGGKHPATHKFRLALLLHGVDISGKPGGLTSCVHDDEDLAHTARAVRSAVGLLREEGEL